MFYSSNISYLLIGFQNMFYFHASGVNYINFFPLTFNKLILLKDNDSMIWMW